MGGPAAPAQHDGARPVPEKGQGDGASSTAPAGPGSQRGDAASPTGEPEQRRGTTSLRLVDETQQYFGKPELSTVARSQRKTADNKGQEVMAAVERARIEAAKGGEWGIADLRDPLYLDILEGGRDIVLHKRE